MLHLSVRDDSHICSNHKSDSFRPSSGKMNPEILTGIKMSNPKELRYTYFFRIALEHTKTSGILMGVVTLLMFVQMQRKFYNTWPDSY